MTNRRNLFVVNYNNRNDNLGDQFIFLTLVNVLKEFGTVCMASTPPSFVSGVHFTGNNWRTKLSRLISVSRGWKVYTVYPPGGGTARPMPTGDHGSETSLNRDLRFVASARAQIRKLLNGKAIMIGRSLMPGAKYQRRKKVDWIGVRDHVSLKLMHDAGYSDAEYFPDLAFLSEPIKSASIDRSICLLSFRERIPECNSAGLYQGLMQSAIEKVISVLKSRRCDTLATFFQVDEDKVAMRDLAHRHELALFDQRADLLNYQGLFSSASLVVSNRLHALLIGARCGAIPLALTTPGHSKLIALFETVGWEALILRADDIDSVTRKLDYILQNVAALSLLVNETFARQRRLGFDSLSNKLRPTNE